MEEFKEAYKKFNSMKRYCIKESNINPKTIQIVINYGLNFLKLYDTEYILEEIITNDIFFLKNLKSKKCYHV